MSKTRSGVTETICLNAEDAEAFAKVRKGKPFSAFLCEKLCALCVKMLFDSRMLSFDTDSFTHGDGKRKKIGATFHDRAGGATLR